jgi:glutamate/tyrosine decarboxylase-like PLP-dependent enzyme
VSKGDLDPKNWDSFRAEAHKMLDKSIDKMKSVNEGRVWSPVPNTLRDKFKANLPINESNPNEIISDILPYGVGNTHPRFFGWVHGAGTPSGIISDIASASMNVNAGGRDHVGPVVEKQVLKWCLEIMGMPKDGSGLIVSGTSIATIIAMKVARDQKIKNSRKKGIIQGQLVGYTSEQSHSCIKQAFDVLGLGTEALRVVPCNDNFEIDLDSLKKLISKDREMGFTPLCVVGTAGAVNMGAIDDLEGIASIAKSENLWFHVDGAFGAAGLLGKLAHDRLSGISQADSLAFDFHKWFQVNYEAGCVLFKDNMTHRASFSDRAEYLRGSERGLAGGDFWAVDYGPELSRGFRALKVWAHLKEHGVEALGNSIDRNIRLAQYLEKRVKNEDLLVSLAPTPLNINCFRFVPNLNLDDAKIDELNEEIVILIQERGIAVPSTTKINNQLAIRINITNHRTQESDLDILVQAILDIGQELTKNKSL